MKSIKTICLALILLCPFIAKTQTNNLYKIDISQNNFPIISNHLSLGKHTNAKGESLDANSLYFIKNGKPWFPAMGEFHFSRFPKEQWESSILKMKACGINVIATYVFWIYHEEEKGSWTWNENLNLKYFAQLCAKHKMYLFVRIGPWCHGEVRNGGFPDWLLKEAKTRTNDSLYLNYVALFFNQIANQLKGLYFKDGGAIIGAQIENEFRFNNPKGLTHILTLKKMAVQAGIDVPYYTATGWPGSNLKQTELIPVWGGYPEAPWDKRTTQLPLSENYLFDSLRSDPTIGNDLLGIVVDSNNYKGYRYPYATAEMGAGIQVTHHRRPIILPQDVLGLAISKTGAGANLMGYYMFHGGINAIGKLSTLQESKLTKYPNDYPIINYDFQSPIGQWGDIKPSYNYFKLFHSFLNNYGEQLATCYTYFPENKVKNKADSTHLRWAVRAKNGRGFIFINQFQRQLNMKDVQQVQFNIRTNENTILKVPELPISIPANTQFILPFNLKLGDVNLVYATTQPFYIHTSKKSTYFFYADDKIAPEYVFDSENIVSVISLNALVEKRASTYKITSIKSGLNAIIDIQLVNGKSISIITLNHQQALNAWNFIFNGQEHFVISNAQLICNGKNILLQALGQPNIHFNVFDNPKELRFANVRINKAFKQQRFNSYEFSFKPIESKTNWQLNQELTNAAQKMSEDTAVNKLYPFYAAKMEVIPKAVYYNLTIPHNIKAGILEIAYEGDTQAIYLNDRLIADDFNMGLPMTLSLDKLKLKDLNHTGKITTLITPFTKDSKVYFEVGVFEKIKNTNLPVIKSIVLKPEYKTTVTGF